MKIFNFFIKQNSLSQNVVKDKIKFLVSQDKIKINDPLFNSLFENILLKVINQRCQDLGFSNSFTNNNNSQKIKIFGESNFLLDNSKWIDIKKGDKLNVDLRLKDDLNFSESHLFLVINEHINFFEINNKEIRKLILPLIKKSNIQTLKDLKDIVYSIFNQEEINLYKV